MSKKLNFEINADTSGLDKSLNKATSSIDSFAKRNEANFKRVGSAVQGVGAKLSIFSAGVVAAAGGAFLLAKKAGEAADRLLDLEQITGISTDALQEYQFVAKIAGVNTEALSNASEGLTRRLAGATSEASPLNVALAQLGVTVKNANGGFKSSEVVMDDLITKLSSMDDQTQRNVLGAQIFGGAWKDLAPIFALGADGIADARQEARDLGLILDNDALNGANNFRIAIEKLKARFDALKLSLGAKLAPLLQNTILPLFEKKILPAIEKMAKFLENLIQKFQELSPSVQKNILIFGGLITALGPLLVALGTLIKFLPIILKGFAVLTGPIGLVVVAIAGLTYVIYKNWDAVKQWAEDLVNWFIDLYNESILFRAGIEALALQFKNMFAVVKFIMKSLWTIIKAVVSNIVSQFKLLGAIISAALTLNPKKLIAGVKAYREAVSDNISTVVKTVEKDFGELTESIVDNVQTAIDNVMTGKKEHVKFEASKESKENLKQDISTAVSGGVVEGLKNGLSGRKKQTLANAGLQSEGISTSAPSPAETGAVGFMAEVSDEMIRLFELTKNLMQDLDNLVVSSLSNTFSQLGDAIGNAIASGGNVLKAMGNALLNSLGSFISDLGGMLIEYGTLVVAKGTLDEIIKTGGYQAIAAGIAAIAVGVAVKAAGAAIGNKARGGSSGSRSGSTTPEVGNTRVNTTVGGSGMDVVFRIAGRDLVSVIDRNRNHLDRIGG